MKCSQNLPQYHIYLRCQLHQISTSLLSLPLRWIFLQIETFHRNTNTYYSFGRKYTFCAEFWEYHLIRRHFRVLGGPFPVQISRLSQNPLQLKLLKALYGQVGPVANEYKSIFSVFTRCSRRDVL